MTDTVPSSRPAVLVLGANGRLGLAATRAFAAAGWAVTVQVRRAARTPWPAGVRELRCDALDVAALSQAGRGAAVIVNGLNPDYTRWDTLLPPLTAAMLDVAAATGARLMLPGNVYNFGRDLPAVLSEATPFAATNPKAAQRIALETAMATAARERGVKSVVIRAGDFLGDRGTWLDLAIGRRLARGRFTHLGPDDIAHAWAWLPDLARVFVQVAERRDALPAFQVLHYAGLTLTGAQLQEAVEVALGRPLQAVRFPWPLLQALAWLPGRAGAMPRALLEMRHLWQRPHRLDETRLAALLGAVPHTPLAQVMREAVAQLPGVTTEMGMAGTSRAA